LGAEQVTLNSESAAPLVTHGRCKVTLMMLAAVAVMTCCGIYSSGADGDFAVPQRHIDEIEVTGPINPASADFIADSIVRAQSEAAAALIIQIDTPGGLLSSARDIVKTLLNSPVPVIAYVAPAGASAASAGTFVVEAANIAAMAPGTTIGAAHPVDLGGGEIVGTMGEKMENFTASFAKAIAHQRGRNKAWME